MEELSREAVSTISPSVGQDAAVAEVSFAERPVFMFKEIPFNLVQQFYVHEVFDIEAACFTHRSLGAKTCSGPSFELGAR